MSRKKLYRILIVIVLVAMILSIIAPLIAVSQPTTAPLDLTTIAQPAPAASPTPDDQSDVASSATAK